MRPRRVAIWFVIVVVCVASALVLCFYPPKGDSRQIAEALLQYHDQCATDGYSSLTIALPPILGERYGDSRPSKDIQPGRACVAYRYERLGIDCERIFDLLPTCWFTRRPTDTNTWTLTCETRIWNPLTDDWIKWDEQLITITNSR